MTPLQLRHRVIRLLLVLVLGSQTSRLAGAEHWIVGRTEHFEMFSSDTVEESQRVLAGLEQFRANYLALFSQRIAAEPRATIVLFASDRAFRPYKPLYEGKPKDVAGYFLSDPDEVTIAMTSEVPSEEADPRQVIYHEYVHLLSHVRETHYPLWLEEGLAELFSTFTVTDGKAEYGQAKSGHVALLQHSALLPLDQLFAVTHESPDYNEESRMGIFYAESWALTHYLLYGQDRANAAKLGAFAERLAAGADTAASFREAFGTDFTTLERALRSYLNGGGYYKRSTPAVGQKLTATFRPASDVERDFALLNLRWRVHGTDDAAAAALALLAKDPNLARPHELLAAIAARNGDPEVAREHWRLAAERNSDNPWVYVQLIRDALAGYQGATMLDVRLPAETIAPLRAWARRARSLSPENADALELAALIEAFADKMDVAVINAVQSPIAKMRNPERGLLALAIVHWRGKDLTGARTLCDLVAAAPRADLVTRAAVSALRYRLPSDEAAGGPSLDDAIGAGRTKGITLEGGHRGEAAKYLDRILAERGTTAAPLALEAEPVTAPAAGASDAWRRADELRKQANTGDANAMFELAVAHACGVGVDFSPALATEWLQKAIEHGHALAKAAISPANVDPELVARFLRGQRQSSLGDAVPPLDQELHARIADAAAAADRHAPIVLFRAQPRYPSELRGRGSAGQALVTFVIAADGHPEAVHATQFSDAASAAAAERSVRNWRFLPAIRDHQPARTLAQVLVRFTADSQQAAAAH